MKLQFHLLWASALHNVNRDEDGRPKTAEYGGHTRGRISSQAKKRAIRYSHFPDGQRAVRTREAAIEAFDTLSAAGVEESLAVLAALAVNHALGGGGDVPDDKAVADRIKKLTEKKLVTACMAEFGKEEAAARHALLRKGLGTEQGLVVSTRELAALREGVARLVAVQGERPAELPAELRGWVQALGRDGLLGSDYADIDTALFGRMVAARPEFNVEAACAVSHAITTHAFAIEGDYFSAGEELNVLEGTGAAITSYAFFGAGVYYQHAVLDLDHLHETLGKDAARTRQSLGLFLDGLVHAQPGGKRNAFASDGAASCVLVSAGDGPTFNHMAAFLDPVKPGTGKDPALRDPVTASLDRLAGYHEQVMDAYGQTADTCLFNGHPPSWVLPARASEVRRLEDLRAFVLARAPAAA